MLCICTCFAHLIDFGWWNVVVLRIENPTPNNCEMFPLSRIRIVRGVVEIMCHKAQFLQAKREWKTVIYWRCYEMHFARGNVRTCTKRFASNPRFILEILINVITCHWRWQTKYFADILKLTTKMCGRCHDSSFRESVSVKIKSYSISISLFLEIRIQLKYPWKCFPTVAL